MPRACVIVLDAVGAGALPDAAEYGDDDIGADTLGNVSRAVGGLDLPNLEALGLGNVEPLEGCPPQAGAPLWPGVSSSGRRAGHDHGSLGDDGRAHAAGIPDVPARLPARRDRPVHAPDGARRARQQGGVRHRDHPGARRGAPTTGKWIVYTSADSVFQIAAHEETIPLEELYEGCKIAREILTGQHRVGR